MIAAMRCLRLVAFALLGSAAAQTPLALQSVVTGLDKPVLASRRASSCSR